MWLGLIIDILEVQMTELDDLRTAVTALQTTASTDEATVGSVIAHLQTVEQQLADLQSVLASGGAVTAADLATLTGSVTQIAQGLKTSSDAAAAADQAAEPSPTPPAPAPPPPAPTPPAPAPPTPTTGP